LDWVEHRTPDPESVRRVERESPSVGEGEKEAIALGLELSCPVVLDDRKARLCARRAGLEITGTLGILLRLRRIGLTSRGIGEDLELLEKAGMRLSPNLRRMVIEAGKQGDGGQH
jgi:predicted nucleic acid-binding protein